VTSTNDQPDTSERKELEMATDPVEILHRRNAEVAQIRGYVDLTEEAKNKRIAEVNERAQVEYEEARTAEQRRIAERLESTKKAVFGIPIPVGTTDAEEAQIHAAYRSAWGEVYSSTRSPESPEHAAEELQRVLGQAERTGDTLLARAAYHRAIDLGVQDVVDSYLASRPQENRAWESYTQAYQEVNQSRGFDGILERSLTDRAFSEAREAR
jgi:hypothetical protein